MTTTVSVTRAQAQLPKLIRSDRITGVMHRQELAAFIVPRERFEALLETMETLANPEAMEAVRKFQAGKMKFRPLRAVKHEFERQR